MFSDSLSNQVLRTADVVEALTACLLMELNMRPWYVSLAREGEMHCLKDHRVVEGALELRRQRLETFYNFEGHAPR